MRKDKQFDDKMRALLVRAGSNNHREALIAQGEIAAALTVPLRAGFLEGSTADMLFDVQIRDPRDRITFPLDFYRPENSKEFAAYNVPAEGRLPERMVGAEELEVTTYRVGNAIDTLVKYAKQADWDVIGRCLQVLENGFTQKANDDAWRALIMAGISRNTLVFDSNAAPGQFTKSLLTQMQLYMRRLAGGNSTSQRRGKLTHVFVSPEAVQDMQEWDETEVDDATRNAIIQRGEDDEIMLYGVRVVVLDELGVGQEYQLAYNKMAANQPNGGLGPDDQEIVIGIDAQNTDSFIMPIREELEIHEDPQLLRQDRLGWFGRMEMGVGVLNNARVIIGSF